MRAPPLSLIAPSATGAPADQLHTPWSRAPDDGDPSRYHSAVSERNEALRTVRARRSDAGLHAEPE